MKAVKKLFGSKKNNKRTQSAASDQSSKATSTGRRNTIAVSSIPPQKSIPARRPTETLVSLSKREKEESKPKPLEVRKVAEDTVAPVLRGNETAIKPDIETQSTLKNRTQMENTPLELSTGEAATATSRNNQEFKDSPEVKKAYDAIPLLDQKKLPRGGCSVDTKAVGRVQFGIPPETIKDSMKLGIPVPQVYIVPVERFCREMGPALGVNLAEFEFPAYFNFFVYKKRCTLVVDSVDAEENICRVFSETLLGPEQFRRADNPLDHEAEDFDPSFPRERIPNFQKEFKHFRIMPDGKELVIETLLNFRHFELPVDRTDKFGVPPPWKGGEEADDTAEAERVEQGGVDDNLISDDECVEVPQDLTGIEKREQKNPWTYSQTKEMGDVATVYPANATPEQISEGNIPRVEIFKMPGGTEYIVHDIDENNVIIGKARFSGHVKVSESMSVDGFGGRSIMEDTSFSKLAGDDSDTNYSNLTLLKTPSFHPPSFGVTVLGNSHGFDKSGSVSGYVLWINGRGVMIDPPPYSSATLEREGIRPRTIVGIILTHCHADHDAGAFQKVLTGSPVVVITTPTIYKSFIRKYAALSALSPALLRHCHRYKPAIIGQPLRFQGATFHFMYTLHTIPCVGFRVEWRGRSMVFTGDHFNSPPAIDKLEENGVLSKARADDLRNMPLQETDLLLHEAGAPPIHTPLDVLLKLPQRVKDRLYVVHTSALPDDCELRVAPTGTAGTIRLDQSPGKKQGSSETRSGSKGEEDYMWTASSEYDPYSDSMRSSFAHMPSGTSSARSMRQSVFQGEGTTPAPLVSLRPASSTDAWFILNLLSAVPFLSSLSYSSTMEVLETARVDAYSMHDVVVPAARRSQVLCVIWEGTCTEEPVGASRKGSSAMNAILEDATVEGTSGNPIWHAGDWTGPIYLQPCVPLSGESPTSKTHDVVAISQEGVKVITIDFSSLHSILASGSSLYRRFLDRLAYRERALHDETVPEQESSATDQLLNTAKKQLNVLELLNCNSALRKLTAIQKRHLESLAVGPISYKPGDRLWGAGTPVDKAFLIISGTASFVRNRRHAGSEAAGAGQVMKTDAETAIKELGVRKSDSHVDDHSSLSSLEHDELKSFGQQKIVFDQVSHDYASRDYATLSRNLQERAEKLQKQESVGSGISGYSGDSASDGETFDFDVEATDEEGRRRSSLLRRRSSRARQANKVLGRLYSRRAFTGGLVFSQGHFLGDVSKMVAGLLSADFTSDGGNENELQYGFGDKSESNHTESALATITEAMVDGSHSTIHNSTLTAGKDGCVVLVFPKTTLIPFLDEYPGLLLSLLGTQVVV